MNDAQMVTMDQILLPYLELEPGRTVYDLFLDRRLALPSPR